jgi:hypothetical protein
MGINAGEQQDAELLTTYLQRTKALDSFHSMLNNDDEEAWNRTLVCQEATREIIHSIFSYVSANLDNCGNCEIVAHIDIADTNRQIIFQNYGDAMDIASGVGVVQDENVSALACVIQNTGAVSNGMADIDVVRNLLKNEHVMDHVQHLARKQYRAHVEASDEVIMTEDHGEEGRPIYRLLKVGHTYQIQKCPLLGYKSEWFPALQVTEEFANEAKERVKSHNRNPLLLSNAVNAANRPKNDLRCPCCGAELVFRIASALQMNSKPFWGCSNYPKCRHSHLIEVDQ